jgi:hypothetical protein
LTDSSGADDSSRDELAIPPLKLLPPSLERRYTTSTTIIREIAGGDRGTLPSVKLQQASHMTKPIITDAKTAEIRRRAAERPFAT